MSRLVLLALTIAGCSYTTPTSQGDDTPAPDGPDGCVSFSTFVDTCALPPGVSLELTGANIFDTNTGELFAGPTPINVDTQTLTSGSGEVKAILASAVVFAPGATLQAIGARPFAIIASDSITLSADARIDVSAGGAGAGASCANPSARGTDRNGGAGGGGGGGFAGAGGLGGAGDSDDGASPAPGGVGGVAIAFPDGLLGGCPGAPGGDDDNDIGGAGGAGGGGVLLAAGRRIDIATGGIDAGGAGGRGGDQHSFFSGDAGGGGGGSGGMIVLESPTVICGGTLAANGGGGGEGSGAQQNGDNGERGNFSTARASGGSGSSATGTDGGLGGAKLETSGASVGGPLQGGGGGGGGGAGFIHIVAPTLDLTAATVSPNPS